MFTKAVKISIGWEIFNRNTIIGNTEVGNNLAGIFILQDISYSQ